MSNIQEQIKQVEEKAQDLRIKLMVEEGILKRLKLYAGALDNPEQPLLPLSEDAQDSQPVAQQGSLVEHIRGVLSENGGSVHVKDICKKLASQGVTTGAKAGLASAIACAMHRREDLFQRVRRGMYRLRTRDKTNL
jgi:hypothetical protein